MRIELLVDAPAFWERLEAEMAGARRRVLLQTFSFEGDSVGEALGHALEGCPARDRRLLVDGYSLLYQNDRLIPGPALLDPSFRRELWSSRRWVRRLRAGGTGVRVGRPPRPTPCGLVRRSHKKLAVVDDVAWVGGINFCEHNFAWHDLMLRIEDAEVADHLAEDFDHSWSHRSRGSDVRFGPLRFLSADGTDNRRRFAPVLDAIDGARRSLDVVSPYLSPPFTDAMRRAADRGVEVSILTPDRNNKPNLARFILEASHRHGFRVHRYPGRMNHTKAMLVDGSGLVLGSSNFDAMSYHVLDELFVMTSDAGLVEQFRRLVWEPDVRAALGPGRVPTLGTRVGHRVIRAASRLAAAFAAPAAPCGG